MSKPTVPNTFTLQWTWEHDGKPYGNAMVIETAYFDKFSPKLKAELLDKIRTNITESISAVTEVSTPPESEEQA